MNSSISSGSDADGNDLSSLSDFRPRLRAATILIQILPEAPGEGQAMSFR